MLAVIVSDALAAAPWIARVSSGGATTCGLRALVSVDEGGDELSFAVMDVAREEIVDTWSYHGLRSLRAPMARMVAYAGCVADIVARAAVTDRLSDVIPAPALLVLPELATQGDFERARLDVELEELAVARLRGG